MEALHSPYKVYVPQLLVFTILTGKKILIHFSVRCAAFIIFTDK